MSHFRENLMLFPSDQLAAVTSRVSVFFGNLFFGYNYFCLFFDWRLSLVEYRFPICKGDLFAYFSPDLQICRHAQTASEEQVL